jgi:hypothetical protein
VAINKNWHLSYNALLGFNFVSSLILQHNDVSCSDILRRIHICILNAISISLDSLLEAYIQDLVNYDTSLFVMSMQNAASFLGIVLRLLTLAGQVVFYNATYHFALQIKLGMAVDLWRTAVHDWYHCKW